MLKALGGLLAGMVMLPVIGAVALHVVGCAVWEWIRGDRRP